MGMKLTLIPNNDYFHFVHKHLRKLNKIENQHFPTFDLLHLYFVNFDALQSL